MYLFWWVLTGLLLVASMASGDDRGQDYIIETDEELIERLNLDLPEMAEVKAAADAGDTAAAIKAYADFLRSRPLDHIIIPDYGERNPDYRNKLADDAVDLIISGYGTFQFDDPIDWHHPGMVTVCRFPHFPRLSLAYYHTRDAKYAQAIARDITSFIEQWPWDQARPVNAPWLKNSVIDPEANPWSPVIVEPRAFRWLDAMKSAREYEGFSDELLVAAFRRLVEDLEYVLPEIPKFRTDHNFAFAMIKYGLFMSQILYEYDRAPEWFAEMSVCWRKWMEDYYYPDGGSKELTLAYGSSVVEQTNAVMRALQNEEGLDDLVEIARRANVLTLGLVRPDRWMPAYGDLEVRAGSVPADAQDIFGLDWAEYIASHGESGPEPPFTSYPPDGQECWTGYYAMRSDWGPDALFLFVDGGVGGSSHVHRDKLSIEVMAHGANFIIDPGTNIYHDTGPSVRYNLKYGFLHNTITVDGVDQGPGPKHATEPLDTVWETRDDYDLFEGEYNFEQRDLQVTHRRRVVFVKPHLWVITDTLEGEGSHLVERNFQCAASTEIEVGDARVMLTAQNGARLVMFEREGTLASGVVTGDPVAPDGAVPEGGSRTWVNGGRGWSGRYFDRAYRPDRNSTAPAPALLQTCEIERPATFTTVLFPMAPDLEAPTKCEWLGDSVQAIWPSGEKLTVRFEDGRPIEVTTNEG